MKRWVFTSEWDVGMEGPWDSKEQMISDLRANHADLFEGDPDYEDFDKCVAEKLYTFYKED